VTKLLTLLKLAYRLSKKDAAYIVFRKYACGSYEIYEQATLHIDRNMNKTKAEVPHDGQ
jgi:hypothetical protein